MWLLLGHAIQEHGSVGSWCLGEQFDDLGHGRCMDLFGLAGRINGIFARDTECFLLFQHFVSEFSVSVICEYPSRSSHGTDTIFSFYALGRCEFSNTIDTVLSLA